MSRTSQIPLYLKITQIQKVTCWLPWTITHSLSWEKQSDYLVISCEEKYSLFSHRNHYDDWLFVKFRGKNHQYYWRTIIFIGGGGWGWGGCYLFYKINCSQDVVGLNKLSASRLRIEKYVCKAKQREIFWNALIFQNFDTNWTKHKSILQFHLIDQELDVKKCWDPFRLLIWLHLDPLIIPVWFYKDSTQILEKFSQVSHYVW